MYEIEDIAVIEFIPREISGAAEDHMFVMFWDGAIYCSHQNENLNDLSTIRVSYESPFVPGYHSAPEILN